MAETPVITPEYLIAALTEKLSATHVEVEDISGASFPTSHPVLFPLSNAAQVVAAKHLKLISSPHISLKRQRWLDIGW